MVYLKLWCRDYIECIKCLIDLREAVSAAARRYACLLFFVFFFVPIFRFKKKWNNIFLTCQNIFRVFIWKFQRKSGGTIDPMCSGLNLHVMFQKKLSVDHCKRYNILLCLSLSTGSLWRNICGFMPLSKEWSPKTFRLRPTGNHVPFYFKNV